jgi:hypothetical protein
MNTSIDGVINVERLQSPVIPDDNKYAEPVHCKYCHRNAMYKVAHDIGEIIRVSYFCISCLGRRLLD